MKFSQLAYLAFAALMVVANPACSPVYYVPGTQNVPLLTDQGQARVAAYTDGGNVEIQGAYAVGDAVGLMLNTGFYFPADEDNGNGGNGQFVEAGAGYFTPISADGRFVFETYGLLGAGRVANHFPSTIENAPGTTGNIESKAFRYGIQPAVGFRSRFFEAAVSAKLLGVTYHDTRGSLIFDNQDQVQYLQENDQQFMLEPALTLRAGLDWGKIQFQYVWGANLTDSDFRQTDSHATLGLIFSFPNKGVE